MLKGLDPLLTPELLYHLCAMGHAEWVVVADANFTAAMLAKDKALVRIPGHSLERVSRAVLSVFPLAEDVEKPVAFMHVSGAAPDFRTPAQQSVVDLAGAHGVGAQRVEAVERFAFYDKVRQASLIIQSGEATAFGNAMFCKGVIL